MSHITNQALKAWEDIEQYVRCTVHSVKRKGQPLSAGRNVRFRTPYGRYVQRYEGGQHDVFIDALVLTILAMSDKLSVLGETQSRWIKPWCNIFITEDLVDIVGCLKLADSLLLNSAADDSYNQDRFKHDLKYSYPFGGALTAPMKRAVAGWFTNREPASFDVLHTCLVFITRLNLPGLTDLEEEAYASWLQTEESIQTSGFTTEEQELFAEWFPPLVAGSLYENWRPKHGPGVVADIDLPRRSLSLQEKYNAMKTDAMIRYLDLRLGQRAELPVKPMEKLSRTSRVIFVPKSIDKLRTISAEPTTLMWYQQGFAASIMHHVKKMRLSQRINLEDQDLSRELARKGSIHGNYATIDLSNASDSISWSLVQEWTKRSALLVPLTCTRSRWAILPGYAEPVPTLKYAPMGSSNTFPVECLIFSAIVESAIRESGARVRDSKYRVYGDDIIVETEFADAVIARLERNGFKVNTSKSFWKRGSHNFRESCGGEYIDGIDVTPCRLSRRFSGFSNLHSFAPSRIEALIKLCNDSFERLPSVRLFLIRKLVKEFHGTGEAPQFSLDGSRGLYSPTPSNYHLFFRPFWHVDYQTSYVCHGQAIHESIQEVGDESIRYYEWLRLTEGRQSLQIPEDRVDAKILAPGLRFWDRVESEVHHTNLFVPVHDDQHETEYEELS